MLSRPQQFTSEGALQESQVGKTKQISESNFIEADVRRDIEFDHFNNQTR